MEAQYDPSQLTTVDSLSGLTPAPSKDVTEARAKAADYLPGLYRRAADRATLCISMYDDPARTLRRATNFPELDHKAAALIVVLRRYEIQELRWQVQRVDDEIWRFGTGMLDWLELCGRYQLWVALYLCLV
mmetsp:Transcript_92914/g.248636  ORF Transcript_92914/g.248636 Transcript_92914/m.248636 type:complete len:131 (+) Transcript_92914:131-523(+)